MHMKMLSLDVTVLLSFHQSCFSLTASFRFSSYHNLGVNCVSIVGWLLVTSSHLLMYRPITFMSLLLTSLKQGWGCPSVLLAVASSTYRRTFRILPSLDCYFQCFAITVRWCWSVLSRAQAWAGFYERSTVAHTACLSTTPMLFKRKVASNTAWHKQCCRSCQKKAEHNIGLS